MKGGATVNQQTMRNLSLFDLLARTWELRSPVEAVQFNADGSALAFACGDGSIAIAPTADTEPAESRIRVSADLGQMTIRPREKPPAPLVTTGALSAGTPPIAAFREQGFIAGTSDGKVIHITAKGEIGDAGIRLGGAIVALDHARQRNVTAVSDGTDIVVSGAAVRSGDVAALAFSPSGSHLAVSSADTVSIWATGDGETSLLRRIELIGLPLTPRWSADGAWLACPLGAGGFGLAAVAGGTTGAVRDFPAAVRNVSWSTPANALIASGAFRIASWSMRAPPLDGAAEGALVTGRAGLVVVEAVAAHPRKPLVAAGYANGQITVAQIGAREELLVKSSGGTVTTLAWSGDGRHLAVGTADGQASLITFPDQLFK